MEPPKLSRGWRLLEYGEKLRGSDELWSFDPDINRFYWLRLNSVYPQQAIDDNHMPVRRRVTLAEIRKIVDETEYEIE